MFLLQFGTEVIIVAGIVNILTEIVKLTKEKMK